MLVYEMDLKRTTMGHYIFTLQKEQLLKQIIYAFLCFIMLGISTYIFSTYIFKAKIIYDIYHINSKKQISWCYGKIIKLGLFVRS